MMRRAQEIEFPDSFLTENYMPRPRVGRIFDRAARCQLVYVVAGAGYGKTQAVRHFVGQQPDAVVRWVQLTESDNIGSHFWENLTHNISFDNPALAAKLREFGFPETLARFKQFAGILKDTEHRSYKTFLVLDDFHLVHSKQILAFVERCAFLNMPGACVILVSRKEPEINAVVLFSKGKAGIVTEDELRFTQEEIAAFLRFRGIPFSPKDVSRFSEATKGWALAIQLLSLVLKRIPGNLELALGTMKQNIFKLLETEAFSDFPESVKKILVQCALISDLPLAPLHVISGGVSFIQNAPGLTSFIWFDSLIGDYRVHPLYLEFLQSKHHLLSPEEKQDTYRQAARWCSENDFYMDAMRYFAKSYQYGRMLETLLSYPFKLPRDTCEYFLDILEALEPGGGARADTSFLLLKNFFVPILLLGMGKYEEARERSFAVIREWERSDTPFALNLLYASYSNLAYIDMYTCTVTHQYDAPAFLKKSVEYFKLSSVPPVKVTGPFAVADIRSFACLVGEGARPEEFDHFLEAARQTAFYVAETFHDMYYGYEDLVACEIAFYKNQLESAKKYAHQAIQKAREKKQYSIEAVASHYLLRISIHEGDYPLTKEIRKQLRGHLDNADFWNRQLIYDLILGLFFVQIGLPALVPAWLVMNEKEAGREVRIPVRELIVSAKYLIASKKYGRALAVLGNSYPREPQEKFLFGELTLSLLAAVARVKTGDVPGAMEDFKRAYSLSFEGVFEMPFVELGRNLRPLLAAASKQADCGAPEEWLRAMDRKASIYAKKAAVILNAYKREKNMEEPIQLSEREREVLHDLYHGLSREEIAENRYSSINTVKKILQSIYVKLDAGNNVDAIRIAIEKGLVE